MNWLAHRRVTCELGSLRFASFNVSVEAFLYHYLSPSTTLRLGQIHFSEMIRFQYPNMTTHASAFMHD